MVVGNERDQMYYGMLLLMLKNIYIMRMNLSLNTLQKNMWMIAVNHTLIFYRLRNLLLCVLPYRKVYPLSEWRVIILSGLSQQEYYTVRMRYTMPLISVGCRLQVIHSRLQSTNAIAGYLEVWNEGKLTLQTELYKPSGRISTIRHVSEGPCFTDQILFDLLQCNRKLLM